MTSPLFHVIIKIDSKENQMENISNIETVQDLLKANEEKSPTETILKAIFDEDNPVRFKLKSRVVFKQLIWKNKQIAWHGFLAIQLRSEKVESPRRAPC